MLHSYEHFSVKYQLKSIARDTKCDCTMTSKVCPTTINVWLMKTVKKTFGFMSENTSLKRETRHSDTVELNKKKVQCWYSLIKHLNTILIYVKFFLNVVSIQGGQGPVSIIKKNHLKTGGQTSRFLKIIFNLFEPFKKITLTECSSILNGKKIDEHENYLNDGRRTRSFLKLWSHSRMYSRKTIKIRINWLIVSGDRFW